MSLKREELSRQKGFRRVFWNLRGYNPDVEEAVAVMEEKAKRLKRLRRSNGFSHFFKLCHQVEIDTAVFWVNMMPASYLGRSLVRKVERFDRMNQDIGQKGHVCPVFQTPQRTTTARVV